MLKKLISIVCCSAMLLTSISVNTVMADEIENNSKSEYDETAPYITVLRELSIAEPDDENNLMLDYELSRMDFAELVCKMFNMNADDDKAVLDYVRGTGIMVGNGDDFRANDAITYNEAVATMIKALGYDMYASNMGGYPVGYINKASELGILKELQSIKGQATISKGYALKLIFNTMRANVPKNLVGRDIDFTPDENSTIFSIYHNVYEKSGQVTANEFTVLYGISEPDKNQISVLDEVYDVAGNLDISSKLGYMVNVIYKDDQESGNKIILGYELAKNKNFDITIASDDIEETDAQYITYRVGKSLKKIKNKVNILVYNGAVVGNDYNLLIPQSGTLTLIGTQNGEYNIAIVHDNETYVVNGTAVDKYMVFDKLGKPVLVLDRDDKKVSIKFSDSNSELSVDALQEDDVLSVEKSKDGNVISVIVYRDNYYTGIISGKNDDEYVLDGYKVKISKSLIKAQESGNDNLPLVQFGKKYKVLLNGNDEIAFIMEGTSATSGYGYLLRMAKDEDEEEKVYVRIFASNGMTLNLELAPKVKLNGDSAKKPTYIVNTMETISSNIQQMIYYETNSDGYINVIDTAVKGYDKNRFSLDYTSNMEDAKQLEYYSKTFGHRYTLKSGGVIFQKNPDVPGVKLGEKDLKIVTLGDIPTQKPYYVDVYDAELSGEAPLIVITQEVHEKLDEETAGYMLVSSVGKGLNADDESLTYIVGSTKDAQDVTIFVAEDAQMANQVAENVGNETHPYKYYYNISSVEDLKRGDVIRYTTNAYGEINVYGAMFLSPYGHPELEYEEDEYIDTESGHYAAGWTSWCHMYDVSTDFLSFRSTRVAAPNSNGEKVITVFQNDSRIPVYLCESKSKKITKITCNDIITLRKAESVADNMLIRVFQGMVKFIVIYR